MWIERIKNESRALSKLMVLHPESVGIPERERLSYLRTELLMYNLKQNGKNKTP